MRFSVTRVLAIGAALFGGLLAGMTADRALIQLPAWEHLGVLPWANFTRAANAVPGFILNPAVGGAALLLTFAAAIALRFDGTAPRPARVALWSAAAVAVAGAVVTRFLLVPALLALPHVGNDGAALEQLFLTTERWWKVNDVLHVLAFGFNLWALVELLAPQISRATSPMKGSVT
jgi:hypothetical protein